MQHTPGVPLPREQREHSWYPYVAAIALILIAIFLVALMGQSAWLTPTASAPSLYENPELIVALRDQPIPFNEQFLRENPEVRLALRWQAEQR